MIKAKIIFVLIFCSGFAFATEHDKQALIDINMGIELNKLEQSAQGIEQSIKLASQALQEMAKHPNISPEQQAQLIETLENIEALSSTFQVTIKELPRVLAQSTPPILSAIDELFSNIQLTIIVVLIAILLVLICALIAIYFWILKPTSMMLLKTTAKVDDMASALKTTAEIVDKTTQQQLLILNHPSTENKQTKQ